MYRDNASNGRLVFTCFNGRVVAIDPMSGRARWSLDTNTLSSNPVMAADASALYLFANRMLVAVDTETGKTRWQVDVPVENASSVRLFDGLVLILAHGRLRAYATHDGGFRWETPSATAVVPV